MGKVVPFRKAAADDRSKRVGVHDALAMVRTLAQDSKCVLILHHAKKRQEKWGISRRQIMTCLRKGRITEGPFVNIHGNWQVNVSRTAAGEEVTCVVAIEWDRRLIVVTVF
jgi:hypothetical protein